VNIARAAGAGGDASRRLDLPHLARLSGDAADLAVAAVLRASPSLPGATSEAASERELCDAATTLLRRWGPTSPTIERRERDGAWREWNAGEAHALRVVGANAARLRSTQHRACAAHRAARGAAAARRAMARAGRPAGGGAAGSAGDGAAGSAGDGASGSSRT
jgi:hypothetical protein